MHVQELKFNETLRIFLISKSRFVEYNVASLMAKQSKRVARKVEVVVPNRPVTGYIGKLVLTGT